MDVLSCKPSSWKQTRDPSEIESICKEMETKINEEEVYKTLEATEYEKCKKSLLRILNNNFFDLETSLKQWKEWVAWRHTLDIDAISDEDVKNEKEEGVIQWRGRNKSKMDCCVLTGRLFFPRSRKGTPKSFRKYILKSMDDKIKDITCAEEQSFSASTSAPEVLMAAAGNTTESIAAPVDGNQDTYKKVCFVYDRRGMTFENIDTNYFIACKMVITQIRDFYSDRLGIIYVLESNWFFWTVFMVVIYPLLFLFSQGDRFHLVETVEELLEHFNEEELLLCSLEEPVKSAEEIEEKGSEGKTISLK